MPVAVVTGAAGGIGREVCALLVENGYRVVGIDVSVDSSGTHSPCVQHMLHMDICNLTAQPGDEPPAKRPDHSAVAPGARLKELLASLAHVGPEGVRAPPRCDLLVCNAAVQRLGMLADLSQEDFDTTLATNLRAPAMMTQLLLPELQAARGSVVMVSSIHANLTKPGFSAYAASKGGLVSLAKALAVELGPLGIRVNAVLPAATNTPMLRAGFASALAGLEQLDRLHPVQRICDPREIGEFILFLADAKKSGFINGSALQIDGGIGARLLDPDILQPSLSQEPATPEFG